MDIENLVCGAFTNVKMSKDRAFDGLMGVFL